MESIAFKLALVGIGVLILTLPIHMVVKRRIYTWGCILIALNFLSQSYMVMKEISLPYIAMPNVVLLVYFTFLVNYNALKQK